MYSIPVSNEMMKQCKIPFGIACSPYAKTAANEVGNRVNPALELSCYDFF